MPFEFIPLKIPDVVLVKPKMFGDDRGFFMEAYKHSDFAAAGIADYFLQDNHSRSSRSVLRGLHYQKDPKAQGKLVRCLSGRIFDVAVDIRKSSPTYSRWVAEELTGENGLMLYVPPGFAHGFLVLSETADIVYKCTEEYAPESDRGIIWNDPDIDIAWPSAAPVLSTKDSGLPPLRDADNDFVYEAKT
jgi:dTDP-4-dehydrorhamnose 3,5-epimerase